MRRTHKLTVIIIIKMTPQQRNSEIVSKFLDLNVSKRSRELVESAQAKKERGILALEFPSIASLLNTTRFTYMFIPTHDQQVLPVLFKNHPEVMEKLASYDTDNEVVVMIQIRNKLDLSDCTTVIKVIKSDDYLKIDKNIKKIKINHTTTESTNFQSLKLKCSYCKADLEKRLSCSRCRLTYYCDANCQKLDWSTHKVHCRKYALK